MDSKHVPNGWVVNPSNISELKYDFWKAFHTPDGLEVNVCVWRIQDKYQVKTVTASRSSGPYESVDAEVQTLDEAISAAFQECDYWDSSVSMRLRRKKAD